jgi:hypothetical protein
LLATIFLAVCIYGFFYLPEQPKWAFISLGVITILGETVFILGRYETSATILDRVSGKVIFERKTLLRHTAQEYSFDEIKCFEVVRDADVDRPAGYIIQMELLSGKQIEIENSFERNQNQCKETCNKLNDYLQHSEK